MMIPNWLVLTVCIGLFLYDLQRKKRNSFRPFRININLHIGKILLDYGLTKKEELEDLIQNIKKDGLDRDKILDRGISFLNRPHFTRQ